MKCSAITESDGYFALVAKDSKLMHLNVLLSKSSRDEILWTS